MGCGCGGRKGVKGKAAGAQPRKSVAAVSNPNTGWRVKQTGNVVYPPLAEPPFFSIAEARAWVRNEGHGTIVRA